MDEAFIKQIAEHQRALYAFIRAICRRPQDADDIFQETFVVIWRKRAEFRLGTNFFAWAATIARYEALAYARRQGRAELLFDDDLLEQLAEQAELHADGASGRKRGQVSFFRGRPRGRRVEARFYRWEELATQASLPNGVPRATHLRTAATSASDCGWLTTSSQPWDRRRGQVASSRRLGASPCDRRHAVPHGHCWARRTREARTGFRSTYRAWPGLLARRGLPEALRPYGSPC